MVELVYGNYFFVIKQIILNDNTDTKKQTLCKPCLSISKNSQKTVQAPNFYFKCMIYLVLI